MSPGALRGVAAATLAAALTTLSAASPARASDDDGVYGRLAGDLDLRLGAGVAIAEGGPSLAATGAVVYVETAGVYVHYTDALGDGASIGRSIAAGVHVQPLFVARYAYDLEHGPARLDLLLDSAAFEIGAVWQAGPHGAFADEPGLELGLGAGLPILPSASGPFLDFRAALRWRASDLRAPGAGIEDRGAVLTMTLGWHQLFRAHAVDAGDLVRP